MELTLRTGVAEQKGRPGDGAPGGRLVDWRASLRRADHACCCPARPAVVVIMPPAPGRPSPVDLLLCAHHYRVYARTLAAAGAEVFDVRGAPLSRDPFALEASR